MVKKAICITLGAAALALAGCDSGPDVATYSAPKEIKQAPAAQGSAGMPAMPGMAQAAAHIHQPEWKAPQSWQALPLDQVRKGAWKISNAAGAEAEITVTVFPGNVGSMLMNVNRWRGQLGQQPISEAELAQYVVSQTIAKERSHVVTLENSANNSAMIVALVPHDGATWFFKVMGDAALIKADNAQWQTFLQSIYFAGH